eukprot:TRINITY_DN11100_c0_g1_i1.p1 TRINITY_DN11100_c0_g1~~TRINITY_DN11100_c0_g1_i1.p1  ORF type:complete len:400 (+),score=163.50 TRINITY_DN11100_c0_g1_i1:41-1201(+)
MPPKAKANVAQAKAKAKAVEEKTFGMKNKKGAKAQKQVQSLKSSMVNKKAPPPDMFREQKKAEKKEKEEREKELAELFKPVIKQQKVPVGADPKSVVCEFFKKGQCTKGPKCKFSHDMAIERKAATISVYSDPRELQKGGMESWDQSTLEQVVGQKHKEHGKSEKICNQFLQALEQKKYGWFWECPNGDKCVYRHALPPGYVLKQKESKKEETVEERPLDEILEELRSKLTGPLTPVTPETFKAWKAKKLQEKEEKRLKEEKDRQESIKSGKAQMSGRELLDFRPELFVDDDETLDIDAFKEENVEEEVEEETKPEDGPLNYDPNEQDHDDDLVDRLKQASLNGETNNNNNENGAEDGENGEDGENNNNNVPIDESLFTDDADIPE